MEAGLPMDGSIFVENGMHLMRMDICGMDGSGTEITGIIWEVGKTDL